MTDLVFLQNQQALTTSLKVAECFGKEHIHVMRDIRDLSKQLEDVSNFGHMFSESRYADSYGRQQPMFLMNRDGFTLLAMGFTGKKALKFKLAYIQAFNAMEAKLAELQSEQWKEARLASKAGYKKLSATIQKLARYATACGSKTPEKVYYSNFARLINKTLGINPKSRDILTHQQLYEIDRLQDIAAIIVDGNLAKGADYHQPYKECKAAFETYAQVAFIPQRLSIA